MISTLFDRLYPVFQELPRGRRGGPGDRRRRRCPDALRHRRGAVRSAGHRRLGRLCDARGGQQARRVLRRARRPGAALPAKAVAGRTARYGAIDARGQAILDIAVMSFDAAAATAMFRAFDVQPDKSGPRFSAAMERLVLDKGLDLYREICCALGSEATAEHHRASCVASGSSWSAEQLAGAHAVLSQVPLSGTGPAPVRVPALRHHAAADHQRPGTAGARRPAVGAGHLLEPEQSPHGRRANSGRRQLGGRLPAGGPAEARRAERRGRRRRGSSPGTAGRGLSGRDRRGNPRGPQGVVRPRVSRRRHVQGHA